MFRQLTKLHSVLTYEGTKWENQQRSKQKFHFVGSYFLDIRSADTVKTFNAAPYALRKVSQPDNKRCRYMSYIE